jgi:superfamily II DNA/RNA helicase
MTTTISSSSPASNAFEALGLAGPLLQALEHLGFEQPTPVQAQAIPAALQGGDWMVSSQTGSGKTAAFLLPVLQRLNQDNQQSSQEASRRPAKGGWGARQPAAPRAVVLCPTRELAQQVAADAIDLVRGSRGIRIATVVGGMPFGKQLADLQGASLVVATPGRLLDLADRKQILLGDVQVLVVDEADRMLDLGFAEDLEAIHNLCAQRSQTLMFSATFAQRIMRLAAQVMREPGRLELATAQDKHDNISQTLHWADNLSHKRALLDHWLRDVAMEQAVVFTSTQADADMLAETLQQTGHAAVALHGAMPQSVRTRRLQNLRDGRIRILVATDVAARGIDVPTISHVINFGLPMKAEDYVHRIGRTGRAGRSGTAITLAEHRERHKIRAIEQFTRQPIATSTIAGLEPTPPKPRDPKFNARPGQRPGRDGGRPNHHRGGPGRSGGGAQADGGRKFGGPRRDAGARER